VTPTTANPAATSTAVTTPAMSLRLRALRWRRRALDRPERVALPDGVDRLAAVRLEVAERPEVLERREGVP
jgi:hypothetical protein